MAFLFDAVAIQFQLLTSGDGTRRRFYFWVGRPQDSREARWVQSASANADQAGHRKTGARLFPAIIGIQR